MNSNFTATAKEYLLNESPVHTVLSFTDGTVTYQLTDQTVQGSVTIDYACSGGIGLELGACVATQLDFSMYTDELPDDFSFKAFNEVTLSVVCDEETILIGTYRIDGCPRMQKVVSVTAFDHMIYLDKYIGTEEWLTECATKPTFAQLVRWCCTKCGLTCSVSGGTRRLMTYPTEEMITYRQVVSWALQCMGLIGYMDASNRLCARYPDRNEDYTPAIAGIAVVGNTIVGRSNGTVNPTIIKTFAPTDRFKSDFDEEITVTGVRYIDYNGNSYLSGKEGLVVDLSMNPFLDNPGIMVGEIFGKINGRTYTVMDMETVTCPWITPLDWIAYTVDGETKYGIVTNATHKINGHSVIACSGELEQQDLGTMSDSAMTSVRQSEQRVNEKLTFQAQEIEVLGEQILLKVDANGVISAINLSEEGVQISADKINLSGYVTISSLTASGTTAIDGSRITTGYISADRIAANSIAVSKLTGSISNNGWSIDLDNGTFTIGNISASNINTGTLSAARIAANSIAVEKLTGSITNGNWEINLTNGTMTIGNISAANITTGTMSAARISGGTLTLGGANDVNGTLEILDASGNVVGTLDKDGLTTSSANITGGSIEVTADTESTALIKVIYGDDPNASTYRELELFPAGIRANGEVLTLIQNGYVNLSYGGLRPNALLQADATGGFLRLTDINGTNTITITPTSNVATLSYTVVSTF